jgi:hypothetical protein
LKNFPKRVRSAFAFGLAVFVLLAYKPSADEMGNFGTVTGRVVDQDTLQPISGATVTLGNIVSITAVIDQGGFTLRKVPVGTRPITISAVGWKMYRTQVTVVKDRATDIGVIGLPSSLNR